MGCSCSNRWLARWAWAILTVLIFLLGGLAVLRGQTSAVSGTSAVYSQLFIQQVDTGRSVIFVNVRNIGITNHVFQWTVAGGPTSCTLLIESSTDAVTWSTESSQTCTTAGTVTLAGTYMFLTVNLDALSGGTNPNISVNYRGYLPGQGLPVREAEGGTGNSTAFTTGSVVFKGATGYSQNNAKFFWDNSNYRLCLLSNSCVNAFDVGAGKAFITSAGAGTFNAGITVKSDAAGNVAATVQGAASQSANLSEWKNNAGTVLASVSATGVITPTSGESYTGRPKYSTVPIGSTAYASFGTDTTLVAGTIYWAEVFIPRNITLTGVGVLNGATVGTDKWIVALYTSAGGTVAANSALAGTTSSGANAFQQIAFTSTYAAVGPARYWIAFQSNGTTDTLRTVAANTFVDVLTKSATGTFGTLSSLTVPTTFTADVGPIAYVY